MRSSRWIIGLGLLAFGLQPGFAAADDPGTGSDVQEQLQIMQQQMRRMQDELRRTKDELDAAKAQMGRAPAPAPAPESGLSAFFDRLEFSGWISGEYFYNFNDPDNDALAGANVGFPACCNPFTPDANSFQFSQLWFSMEHPVSEEHRAGFRADIFFGDDAGTLSGANTFASGGEEDLKVYQAYVSYLAPIANGIQFDFGVFGTYIGAEVIDDHPDANFNITRSNVYNLLQPIAHTGLRVSGNLTEEVDWGLAVVNENRSFTGLDVDFNDRKSLMWHMGWTGEMVGVSFNGIWGSSGSGLGVIGDEEGDELILDWIISLDPTENLSTYVNFDYLRIDGPGLPSSSAWGVSWNTKYQITEKLSQALRFDWVDDDGGVFGVGGDSHIWTITTTTAYKLTDNLTLRGEVRFDQNSNEGPVGVPGDGFKQNDRFRSDSGSGFPGTLATEGDQLLVGAQVVYTF